MRKPIIARPHRRVMGFAFASTHPTSFCGRSGKIAGGGRAPWGGGSEIVSCAARARLYAERLTTRRRWLGQTRPPDLDVNRVFPPGLRCGGDGNASMDKTCMDKTCGLRGRRTVCNSLFGLIGRRGRAACKVAGACRGRTVLQGEGRLRDQAGRQECSNVFLQRWANARQRGRHVEMPLAGARRNELRHLPRQSEAQFGLLHPVRRFDAAERLRQSRQRGISQMHSRLPLG